MPGLIIRGLEAASRQSCLILDCEMAVQFCNVAARRTLGPVLRQPLVSGQDLIAAIKEEYRDSVHKLLTACASTAEQSLDLKIRGNPDHVIILHLNATAVGGPQEGVIGYCLEASDVSSNVRVENTLRESFEFNQAVFRHSPIGISVRDRFGRLLSANPAWCRIWNHSEREIQKFKAIEKRTLEFDEHDRYLGPWQEKVREIYQKGGELFIPEIELTGRRPLATKWISHYLYAIKGECGAVERVVILTEDLTERKRHEQERARAHRMETLGLLAGGIAHGFNNVLQGFLGHVALAKEDLGDNENSRHHLTVAEEVAEQANHLTQQLLTFAKGGEPVRQPTDTVQLVTDAVSIALGSRPVTVSLSLPQDLPRVDVDSGQIGRAIQNIVLNAAQATPEGGRITVTARADCSPDSVHPGSSQEKFVRLQIADTGHGIPSDNLHRIWDPYFSTREGQSGLGLTAAYAIVRKHKGLLKIDSTPGHGTTVDIWLPACCQPADIPLDLNEVDPAGTERVLVMDDESFIRELIAKALTRHGYKVTLAADGAEAVHLYEQARSNDLPFDIVILDLVVSGGMGGREAFERLRRIDPTVNALVCSGYSADPIMANHRQYGFVGVVKKPFRPKALAQAVRFHCDRNAKRTRQS